MKRTLTKRDKLVLIVPAFWAAVFDISITIVHQPKDYWNGNLKAANEGNPIGAFFMANHVGGVFFISAIWLVLIGVLGYYLPRKIGRVFLLFTLIAHSYAVSTWISPRYGFWYPILLFVFNSVLFYVIEDMANRVTTKGATRQGIGAAPRSSQA